MTLTPPPPPAAPLPPRRPGVSRRIAVGFAVVLLLHIAIAALNHFGLTRAGADFATYQANTQAAQRVVAIDRNVFQLQRNVMLFTHTGSSGTARRVQQLYDELSEQLNEGRSAAEKTAPDETYGVLSGLLDSYMAGFEQVKQDRERRRELAYTALPQIGAAATGLLNRIAEEAWERGDFRRAALAGRANEKLLETSADALIYLHSPDSQRVTHALVVLDECRGLLEQLAETAADPTFTAPVTEVQALVPRYEETLLKMVQTTRGYLHLVNVVMAGEAAEFVRYSDAFKRQTLDGLDTLATRMSQQSQRFKLVSDAISLATILLGVMAAWLIGRSVVPPLNAITHTLTRLARGESDTEIPGLDRRDEIGQMAAAAEVFREKADETRGLLDASRRLGEELRDKNEEMERFAYTVSHDLKSPLVSCTGLLSFALEDLESGDIDEVRASIGRVQDNVARMELCIQDLLDLSRIGRVRHEPETLDMTALLVGVADDLRPRADAAGVGITIRAGLPVVVADRIRVVEVFENLMVNALKYGCPEPGGLITVGSEPADDEIRYFVRDEGPGIDARYHEKIFELFQRLDKRQEGSGAGLTIVARIMEVHGGRAWVESEEGAGACFWVAFPIDPEPKRDRAAEGAVQPAGSADGGPTSTTPQ